MIFSNVLIHPDSEKSLSEYIVLPSQSILLEGTSHIGKSIIAKQLAAKLLSVSYDDLSNHPMFMHIMTDDKSIAIEQIRNISAFTALKVPGKQKTKRVILIEDAETMTLPAQNSLLKILEEPPEGTVIILTSSFAHKLLQTLLSRVQRIGIKKPSNDATTSFLNNTYSNEEIEQAKFIAEGKIGKIVVLLSPDQTDSSFTIADIRNFLKMNMFEQLVKIEHDFKDKTVAIRFVELLSNVASRSLLKTSGSEARGQWLRISQATLVALKAMEQNANSKLALTELVLSLR